MQQVTATNGTTDTGLVLPMLARAGSGRDTMENAFMKGIGKAIMASVITIITGHIRHWTFPEKSAEGAGARFVGVIFLIMASMCFWDWLKKFRSSRY